MTITDETTAKVLAELSSTVRPQDDFFRYVNGAWLERAEIPADLTSTGSFVDLTLEAEEHVRSIIEELGAASSRGTSGGDASKGEAARVTSSGDGDAGGDGDAEVTNSDGDALSEAAAAEAQKIGALFAAFMDEERADELGAAPLAPDFELIAAAEDKDALAAVVGELYKTGVGAPFFVEVDVDRNAPDSYIPWLGQSGLGLPDEAYYHAEQHAEIRAEYQQFIPKLYALARGVAAEVAEAAAAEIYQIEKAISEHHFTVVEERDADKTNNLMSWEEFLASAPGFDWRGALAAVGLTEAAAPQLLIYTPRALTGFAEIWQSAPIEQLKRYLEWHVIISRAPYLSSDIVAANFDFYGRKLSGQEQLRARWKRGVRLVNGVMGEAVGRAYVRRHFPPEYKAQMEQLVADLLAAYHESITQLDWMTPATKQRALEKLATFTPKIAYPDKWRDYSALAVTADDLVGNIRAANAFENARDIAKLGAPVDRSEWGMTPQTVNAYYNPMMNEIVFPAAILQPPFFRAGADPAWNYGSIGAVIGHEIGHGFDDQGSKYDGTGKLNDWWTDQDRAEFEKRTAALVEQYDAYVPSQLGADSPHHVNGELTLGENIGDLGGVSIALKAYAIAMKREGYDSLEQVPVIDDLTGVQRFFISYALSWQEKRRTEYMIQLLAIDPHSPAEFRCNGIVKNVPAFARAFNVQPGDALYLAPEEQVQIW